jgi:signal transduction histidine kinase
LGTTLEIRLKSYPHKDFIYLNFSDNGIGIDLEKYSQKIFGLYQRFHLDRDGKGMGLYIIKSQIEALDGKIKVESEVDKGTTFKILFHNPPA